MDSLPPDTRDAEGFQSCLLCTRRPYVAPVSRPPFSYFFGLDDRDRPFVHNGKKVWLFICNFCVCSARVPKCLFCEHNPVCFLDRYDHLGLCDSCFDWQWKSRFPDSEAKKQN
jgi:hypothetical protein